MSRYPPYTTTVVGAHSVPRWYEALDRLVTLCTCWCISAKATTPSAPITTARAGIAISTPASRYKADIVSGIDCDAFLVEHDMARHYEGLLGDRQLGVGAVDVQDPNIETGTVVAERIESHPWLAPEQIIITSSCGFNHLPRHVALGKLRAMTEAKTILADGTG